ncbi:MAG: DUF6062 family protein [Candidatus Bathyarchaeia archaeon]
MSFDVAYLSIKRAIESSEECFLCKLEEEIENKYVNDYLSELVMDSAARQKIIENRGFCNYHFYKMLTAASKPASPDGHGIALINKSIIDTLIQDFHKRKAQQNSNFDKLLATENSCPVCVHIAQFSQRYISKTLELISLGNEEFLSILEKSKGFCIPHFVRLIHNATTLPLQNQKIINTLIEVEEKNLLSLQLELVEYIKRQSYEFSEKDRAAIAGIVTRSVKKLAGKLGIEKEFREIMKAVNDK